MSLPLSVSLEFYTEPLEYIATQSFYNPILIYSGYHFDLRDLMIRVTRERAAEAAIVFAAKKSELHYRFSVISTLRKM